MSNDDNLDFDIDDLLSDGDDEKLLKNSKRRRSSAKTVPKEDSENASRRKSSERSNIPSPSTNTVSSKSKGGTIEFDNDDDVGNLLDGLGFDEASGKTKKNAKESTKPKPKSVLDDLLGFNETPVSKPPPALRSTLSVADRRPSSSDSSSVFGSYQPSVAAARTSRSSSQRRSVRFEDDVNLLDRVDETSREPKRSPRQKSDVAKDAQIEGGVGKSDLQYPASRRRSSKSLDWLGLGSGDGNEEQDAGAPQISATRSPSTFQVSAGPTSDRKHSTPKDARSASDGTDGQAKSSITEAASGSSREENTDPVSVLAPLSFLDAKKPSSPRQRGKQIENVDGRSSGGIVGGLTQSTGRSLTPHNDSVSVQPEVEAVEEPTVKTTSATDPTPSTFSAFEIKLKTANLENEQLVRTIDTLQQCHRQEIGALEQSHKNRTKITEEMFGNGEARLKSEIDILNAQIIENSARYETERQKIVGGYQEKLEDAHKERLANIDRIKELHDRATDELKRDHAIEIDRLKELNRREVDAAISSQSHLKSIEGLVENLQNGTKELNELHGKVEREHDAGIADRRYELQIKDKQLKDLEDRLLRQQSDIESERRRLQGLILKLEQRIEEQNVRNEQERWALIQEKGKIEVERESMRQERRTLEQRLDGERELLEKSKLSLLDEQKTIVRQSCDERRSLAEEHAQMLEKAKILEDEKLDRSYRAVKDEVELKGTIRAAKEEAAILEKRRQEYEREYNDAMREKRDLKRQRRDIDVERQRLNELAFEVKQRSQEVEDMCNLAIQTRKEGESSLKRAFDIELEHKSRLKAIQDQLTVLRNKEKQTNRDAKKLMSERKSFEETKDKILCYNCKLPVKGSLVSSIVGHDASHLESWKDSSIKDKKFLEEESVFLETLRNSPYCLSSTKYS